MQDDLGDRMKMYERDWANGPPICPGTTDPRHALGYLDPMLPICVRLDGRAFHSFTMDLPRPYDPRLAALMVDTTRCLVDETNARVGFTQSDEISLILLRESDEATPYFGGRIQKLTSVLASIASVHFNRELPNHLPEKANRQPVFDARVWNVPSEDEAANMILWRELDAYRNGVLAVAQCHFSHKALHGMGRSDMIQMLEDKGVDLSTYPRHLYNGTYIVRRKVIRAFTTTELDKLPEKHAARTNPNLMVERSDLFELTNLPPLIRVANRVEVLFHGADPIPVDNLLSREDSLPCPA